MLYRSAAHTLHAELLDHRREHHLLRVFPGQYLGEGEVDIESGQPWDEYMASALVTGYDDIAVVACSLGIPPSARSLLKDFARSRGYLGLRWDRWDVESRTKRIFQVSLK